MTGTGADRGCGCKVGRVIADALSTEVNDALRRRWLGDAEETQSVRQLEVYFNERLLESRLAEANVETLDGEVANLYQLLSGETSSGVRTQARRRLEHDGVDVDALTDDFVSHQTIYRHLTNCLDVERDDSLTREEQIQRERDRIGRLRNKSEVVSEEALERLRRNDAITLGTSDVIVNFRVTCEDCGVHRELTGLIQRGGCDCRE
jgi:hypothetical protein